ncbi:type B 50S ribosomal protein L31 [Microbulbifer sp. SSSA002]|uniref:type B 50S ribosomal protein L31 n=1 Tax=Microbulbifer sp. SSSA002 TaxID=3243376 RepID=UPI0040393343
MKPGIHPEYRDVLFHDIAADIYFVVGSTVKTTKTSEYEGKTYPYMSLDVSSATHPFYTGKQHVSKSDGRIAKFNKRFNRKGK